MKCVSCDKEFSKRPLIDGIKRNCQNRKQCFDCSPFGAHATRLINNVNKEWKERKCTICNRIMNRKNERGSFCWTCTNRKNRVNKIARIKEFTGSGCWICSYDKCWGALDFHHVDPQTKLFGLTLREIQFSWDRILPEVKKCVLVCCRCHREIHAGLIADQDIKSLWNDRWNTIKH